MCRQRGRADEVAAERRSVSGPVGFAPPDLTSPLPPTPFHPSRTVELELVSPHRVARPITLPATDVGCSMPRFAARDEEVSRPTASESEGGTHEPSRRFTTHRIEGWRSSPGGADGDAGCGPGPGFSRPAAPRARGQRRIGRGTGVHRSRRAGDSMARSTAAEPGPRDHGQPAAVGRARLVPDASRRVLLRPALRAAGRPR